VPEVVSAPEATGWLAERMSRLGTESAFEVLARARAMETAGRKIIHLEIGEPDFDTPAHVVEAAAEALHAGLTHYVPAPGLPEVREAVADWLARTGRLRTTPDRVIITPGAKPIMWYLMLATCQEGDEVIYPDPGFPMYESIARFTGATPVPLPLREENQFRPDPDELAALVTPRTRLLVLNSPHNPCGSALSRADCEAIAEIAMRNDLLVLTDEVYWAIRYDEGPRVGPGRRRHGRPNGAAGRVEQDLCHDRLAAGFRRVPAGARRAHLPAGDQLRVLHQRVQPACRDGRADGAAGPVDEMVAEFRRRRDAIVEGLNAIDGISCVQPAGAFYAFPPSGSSGSPPRRLKSIC